MSWRLLIDSKTENGNIIKCFNVITIEDIFLKKKLRWSVAKNIDVPVLIWKYVKHGFKVLPCDFIYETPLTENILPLILKFKFISI